MPLYEYRCEDGHTFEVMQKMSDDPVQECQVCGKPVQRVFHPVAVHFKGSGFYNTDYGKKRRGGASGEDGAGGDSKPGSSGDSSSGDSKGGDSSDSKKKESTTSSSGSSSTSSSSSD